MSICKISGKLTDWRRLPLNWPTGIFQVAEKMEKRTCALCPKDLNYTVVYSMQSTKYFTQSENVAAHEILWPSSALVECEDHDPVCDGRNFDVESVKINPEGKKVEKQFHGKRRATVGCGLKSCAKNHHFFCAKIGDAFPVNGAQGTYKLFSQHDSKPSTITQSTNHSRVKRKRGRKKHRSTSIPIDREQIRKTNEESRSHTDAFSKVPFLKKYKEAGLLNDLFEEILENLDVIQEKLMERRYEPSPMQCLV
ncbi:LOW QUALITY PROTEIN: PHD finger protein 11 [Thomomys bottae]